MKKYILLLVSSLILFTISVNAQLFMGSISYDTLTVDAGYVKLFKLNGTNQQVILQDSVDIMSGGFYQFNAPGIGTYIVYAKADQTMYPNTMGTYCGNVAHWDSAATYTISASDTFMVNIQVISVPDWSGSTNQGSCGGFILYGTGGKAIMAGDPVPGINISLEQIPGGIIKASTETDVNGYYTVDKIPDGSTYGVIVNIPGLPMDSTHTVAIVNGDSIVNVNFIVDTTAGTGGIFVADHSITEVYDFQKKKYAETKLYPNPSSDVFILSMPYGHGSIQIYDFLGNKVAEKTFYTNKIRIDLASYSKGIYFANIMHDGVVETKKLILK